MSIGIIAIPVDKIDVIWPELETSICKTAKRQSAAINLDDVKLKLLNLTYILLTVNIDKKIIAYCILSKTNAALVIEFVSGVKMSLWLPKILDVCKLLAQDSGLGIVRGHMNDVTRKGWIKKLKPYRFVLIDNNLDWRLA